MIIEIKRMVEPYQMKATNEAGNQLEMDATIAGGGAGAAFSPMQLLMAGLGGCSTIDVISILKKQRVLVRDIQVTVTGEREKDATPSLFTTAHVHFKVFGQVEEEKVKRAIELSMTKYCSVAKTLEKTAMITSSFELLD